ncbi:hypothetical protein IL54_3359 [Sphingobium sp. ba1]|nr:hypothetical protein IL54_3359 [Sphingobium sp. ba1]
MAFRDPTLLRLSLTIPGTPEVV